MEKARGLREGSAGQRSPGARVAQLSRELSSRREGGQKAGSCVAAASAARAGSGGWRSPWPLRQRLSPFRASSGLSLGSRFPRSQRFRSSPPGAAVNYPPAPTPRPPSGARAGPRGGRGTRGPARSHPRPAAAAGSAASGAAAGVKRRESINQPTQPSPKPGAPPAGPALCLARLPARGLGSRAGPLRGPGGAARSHQRPRWPESRPILSHPVTGTIQA